MSRLLLSEIPIGAAVLVAWGCLALGALIGATLARPRPRPTTHHEPRQRPQEPVQRIGRHRSTPGVPQGPGRVVLAHAPRPRPQASPPGAPPTSDVRVMKVRPPVPLRVAEA